MGMIDLPPTRLISVSPELLTALSERQWEISPISSRENLRTLMSGFKINRYGLPIWNR
jgi:hypothetical protein